MAYKAELPCWESTDYLSFDLDGLVPERVWNTLYPKHHDLIAFLWMSPSRKGSHAGVFCKGLTKDNYLHNWRRIAKKLGWEKYNHRHSFSEILYVGHDPDAYLAKKPRKLKANEAPPVETREVVKGEGSLDLDIAVLLCLSPARYTHHDLIKVFHAFTLKWGADPRVDEAKEAVRAWAKGMGPPNSTSVYRHSEFERFWREGLERADSQARPVQMGSVVHMAKEDNLDLFERINARHYRNKIADNNAHEEKER